jgi:cystathionine beta-lyase/cystathionine gamma-synthase
VYGGTQRYLRKIPTPNSEIELDFCDFSDIEVFKKMIKPKIKVCWLETPTNPTLKIVYIQKISDALKGTGVFLVVDNTFSTQIITTLSPWERIFNFPQFDKIHRRTLRRHCWSLDAQRQGTL